MSVINKLSSSLNIRDQEPNKKLAKQIAQTKDKKAVKELFENLNNKNRSIAGDCIKTIDEIGVINSSLISPYVDELITLLESKNNRMQWGAMAAINSITEENPKEIYAVLPRLAAVADAGTVITRDNYVSILTKLTAIKKYSNEMLSLINEQLLTCPSNQAPMYAENVLPFVDLKHKSTYIKTLSSRLNDFTTESKRKRVEKILKKLSE